MAVNYMFLLKDEDAKLFSKLKAKTAERAGYRVAHIEILREAMKLLAAKEKIK